MQDEIIQLLGNLNQEFYDTFAGAFANSRGVTEPGLERVLAQVRPGARVLDLGCGHGRVGLLLPPGCAYVGLDFSGEMLALARERAETAGSTACFCEADLLSAEWPALAGGPYDWIILRAVLHHIPGYRTRLDIVRRAAALLAPGGRIMLANWQFLSVERLRQRLHPWSEIDLSPEDVESGDYLMDWRREGYGFRYVHLLDEAETRRLASAAGLRLDDLFRADGRENNLTLYALLKKMNK